MGSRPQSDEELECGVRVLESAAATTKQSGFAVMTKDNREQVRETSAGNLHPKCRTPPRIPL